MVRQGEGEYVVREVLTHTIEGYFSIFRRGMKGVYQRCGKQHLHRYLAKFDLRYNNRVVLGVEDSSRGIREPGGIVGRRLMYRDPLMASP